MEEVLPSAEMLVDTAKGAVDKTSLIRYHFRFVYMALVGWSCLVLALFRLTVAYLKSREVVKRGNQMVLRIHLS